MDIIKYLPYLLWIGLFLRFYYHWVDKDFPFTLTSDEGKKNIKKSIGSVMLVGIAFAFALIIKADDNIDTSDLLGVGKLIFWIGCYIAIGWFIDSVFFAVIGKSKVKIDSEINKIGEDVLPK